MKFTIGGDVIPFFLTEKENVIVSNNIEELFDDIFRVELNSKTINVEKVGSFYKTIDDIIVDGTNIGKKFFTIVETDTIDEGIWVNKQDLYTKSNNTTQP